MINDVILKANSLKKIKSINASGTTNTNGELVLNNLSINPDNAVILGVRLTGSAQDYQSLVCTNSARTVYHIAFLKRTQSTVAVERVASGTSVSVTIYYIDI